MKSYEYLPSPENGGSVHVLMPFYSAEEENALKNRRGPFSVIEILKEVFNEDFFAAVDRYVETYPDLIKKFTGRNDADAFRLDLLSEPRIEDCFEYDYRYLAVDLVFDAVVNTITSGNEEGASFHIPFEMLFHQLPQQKVQRSNNWPEEGSAAEEGHELQPLSAPRHVFG